ncbi:MAG: hypothetical protein GTO14_03535 [Anaerolineales bacterium]|nr:hypothetical protein [Anaerolineales bacterium]
MGDSISLGNHGLHFGSCSQAAIDHVRRGDLNHLVDLMASGGGLHHGHDRLPADGLALAFSPGGGVRPGSGGRGRRDHRDRWGRRQQRPSLAGIRDGAADRCRAVAGGLRDIFKINLLQLGVTNVPRILII